LSKHFRAWRSPLAIGGARRGFAEAQTGSTAVEFAIIGPVLLLLMTGIFTYGGYFLTAHTVQQLANDAARASIAGLDDEERLSLARDAMQAGIRNQEFMRGDLSSVELARSGSTISVSVTYDASEDVYWTFQSLLPVPEPRISRRSTIRLGGY
jgi:Flp pilus assembly protein TadG